MTRILFSYVGFCYQEWKLIKNVRPYDHITICSTHKSSQRCYASGQFGLIMNKITISKHGCIDQSNVYINKRALFIPYATYIYTEGNTQRERECKYKCQRGEYDLKLERMCV